MKTYSQAGQDVFVLSFFKDDYAGYFVDVGCALPKDINNTMLLEERGWRGVSLDINNLSNEWKIRNTPFICMNALECDYKKLFETYNIPRVIDYLSLDIEGSGLRFLALKKVFEADVEFKIITIEHDAYRGYADAERTVQRQFLTERGYFLLCSNVTIAPNPFEDWWINPKYINKEDHMKLFSDGLTYSEILKRI